MKRDSFVFYRSFFEAIEKLKKNDKLTVYSHLCKYALGEEVGELDGVPGAIFDLIKPQIDANLRRYENGTKGAEYGKLGGRPKTPKKPLENPKLTPNENVNVNENVNGNENENVNVNVSGSDSSTEHTHTSFNRPTNPELAQEIIEKGYTMNAASIQGFIDYNEERSWKMDWREALRKWNQQERKQKPNKINFLNNAVPRDDDEREENRTNIAKLIAMQQ